MRQFELTLVNDRTGTYRKVSLVIIALHVIVFGYLAIFSTDTNTSFLSVIILTSLLVFGIYYYLARISRSKIGFHLFFFVLAVGWIYMRQYAMALIPVAFDILGIFAPKTASVLFFEQYLVYPSFASRKTNWDELSNVLLKDAILTIDFKNNRIIQQAIDESKNPVNEQEFNEFCRERLRSSAQDHKN